LLIQSVKTPALSLYYVTSFLLSLRLNKRKNRSNRWNGYVQL